MHSGYKPYKCGECGQEFPYSSSLAIHRRVHTGERPFACRKCPATFTQSTHLRTHMKGVHKVQNPSSCRKRKVVVERVSMETPAIAMAEGLLLMRRAMGKADSLDKKAAKMSSCKPTSSEGPAARSYGRGAQGESVRGFVDATEKKSARTGGSRLDGTPAPGKGQGTKGKGTRRLGDPTRKRAKEEEPEAGDSEEDESAGDDEDRETNLLAAGNSLQNGNVVVKFTFKKDRRQENKC